MASTSKSPWDHRDHQKFMNLCYEESKKSSDPKYKVGAYIVDSKKAIVSSGFNRMPKDNESFGWTQSAENPLVDKHSYVCHAELNAIVNAMKERNSLENCVLYCSRMPCNECAKLIIQFGIGEVVYDDDKFGSADYIKETYNDATISQREKDRRHINILKNEAAKKMFSVSEIRLTQFTTNNKKRKVCESSGSSKKLKK